jgi:diguanylate cyclase (GGDEF)-like protein
VREIAEHSASWLCPESADRERLLDMERRLAPVRHLTFGTLALALVLGGRWVGWWTLIPLAIALVGFTIVDAGLGSRRFPEYRIATAWVLSQVLIAASIALTGGPRSPALAWLVIPVISLPARFGIRGVLLGVGLTIVAVIAVTFGVNASAVIRNPTPALFTLALIVSATSLSLALMRSDVDHRTEAVIDPLTGMLNRNALGARVAELTQQAEINRRPVAVIIGDLDHFKSINDTHGHSAGDAVLCEVAYRIRAELRAYDLAYRLGGEEFLVMLPGAEMEDARRIAEKLRESLEGRPVAGIAVTMSFGVSASPAGAFDYPAVFAAADQALYGAKRGGRNRVQTGQASSSSRRAQRRPAPTQRLLMNPGSPRP